MRGDGWQRPATASASDTDFSNVIVPLMPPKWVAVDDRQKDRAAYLTVARNSSQLSASPQWSALERHSPPRFAEGDVPGDAQHGRRSDRDRHMCTVDITAESVVAKMNHTGSTADL